MEQKTKICVWKNIANDDLEKLAKGYEFITVNPNKPCYDCDGTQEYANKIGCEAYWKLEIK